MPEQPADAATALLAALTVTVPAATTPVAPVSEPFGTAPAAATPAVNAAAASAAVVAPVAAPVAEPVAPAAVVATPVVAAQVQAAVAADGDAPAEPALAQLPAVPAAKPVAAVAAPPAGQASEQGRQQQPGNPAPPVPQAAVAAAYGRDAAQTQQAPAAQQATANAPVAPVSAAAPAAPQRGGLAPATQVPLSRAAETVEHVIRLASERGVTHARIALRPAELGAVDVRLRSTSQGVVATITAHQSEAVQTLQQAASDLRRSLEQQGVTLLQLDIGQSGERSAGRSGADAGGQAGGDRDGSDAGSAGASEDSPTQTTLQLPNGVLVDVLA